MTKKLMKLYVWENVLRDYAAGMIVALAPDMETALALARESVCGAIASAEMGKTAPETTETGITPRFWANSRHTYRPRAIPSGTPTTSPMSPMVVVCHATVKAICLRKKPSVLRMPDSRRRRATPTTRRPLVRWPSYMARR